MIIGIDEIERLKGLPLALLAYEQLLRSGALAELEMRVVYLQLGIKARNFTPAVEEDYAALVTEVEDILSRVGDDFPEASLLSHTQHCSPTCRAPCFYPILPMCHKRSLSPNLQ